VPGQASMHGGWKEQGKAEPPLLLCTFQTSIDPMRLPTEMDDAEIGILDQILAMERDAEEAGARRPGVAWRTPGMAGGVLTWRWNLACLQVLRAWTRRAASCQRALTYSGCLPSVRRWQESGRGAAAAERPGMQPRSGAWRGASSAQQQQGSPPLGTELPAEVAGSRWQQCVWYGAEL
jgi:hypothetical protein